MKLRRYFLTGLLVLAPTVVTGWLVWKIFITVDNFIGPIQKKYPPLDFPGLGFAIVVVLIFVMGFLASNLVGRRLITVGEAFFKRLPLVRTIYGASKELSEVFFTDQKAVFKRVVLVQFPHRESWGLGFVMNDKVQYLDEALHGEVLLVFIPTTPNPTTGFMLVVHQHDSIDVDISVEEAFKMVISGGAFSPRAFSNPPESRPGGAG
jgi:uncharacterized membrane protein